jgi:ABC-2 type transport system permease protein
VTDSHAPSLKMIGRPKGFVSGLSTALSELFTNRDLLQLLISREIKARYKNSSLGLLWSLFKPIIQLMVYYVFIGHFLGAARAIPDFAIFVFTGLTLWGFFSEITQGGTESIITNQGLVKKIYLPRELFPLAAAGSALFNFGVQLTVLLVATLVLGAVPWHIEFLYLIPAVLLILIFGLALGMALGAINVYLRDTEHLVGVALILGFWASPILYSMNFVQAAIGGTWLETLYLSNPVTIAIIAMQKAVWISGSNDPSVIWPPDLGLRLLVALVVSLVLLIISQRIFSRLQGNFAQEL